MSTPSIADILSDPCTSYWLEDALRTALKRDLLDSIRDAELLAKLLNERWEREKEQYWIELRKQRWDT